MTTRRLKSLMYLPKCDVCEEESTEGVEVTAAGRVVLCSRCAKGVATWVENLMRAKAIQKSGRVGGKTR